MKYQVVYPPSPPPKNTTFVFVAKSNAAGDADKPPRMFTCNFAISEPTPEDIRGIARYASHILTSSSHSLICVKECAISNFAPPEVETHTAISSPRCKEIESMIQDFVAKHRLAEAATDMLAALKAVEGALRSAMLECTPPMRWTHFYSHALRRTINAAIARAEGRDTAS